MTVPGEGDEMNDRLLPVSPDRAWEAVLTRDRRFDGAFV